MATYNDPAAPQNADGKGPAPIAQQWAADDAERLPILDRARLCAALTKPWVLPLLNQQPNQKLPQNFQSIGARGIMTMEGKMLTALWPNDRPWFHLDLAGEVEFDPDGDPKQIQINKAMLFLHELVIQAKLESAATETEDEHNSAAAFRTAKRASLSQLLITGDTLEQLTDDYTIKVYRRDQYVTRRDGTGNVLYHIVKECIDPLGLPKAQLSKARLPEAKLAMPVAKRMQDLYTRIEWTPRRKRWLIEQEMNGHTVNDSVEKVSPFFSTPYELSVPEHYGRGFIELILGDLSSLDTLGERELDFAALASKLLTALDNASDVRDTDLEKKSGSVIRARVEQGKVMDIAFLNVDKTADFAIVFQKAQSLRKELGAAMLIESETTPKGDRVTAFQAERVAMELESALGGTYAPIADHQQRPLLKRVIYQMTRDRLLPKLPAGAVEVKLLTGIAALSRASKTQDLLTYMQAIAPFQEAIARIDAGVLATVLARYQNISEPGLVKTDAEYAKEQQQAIALQTQQAAGQQAAKTAGTVIENFANPSNQVNNAPAPAPQGQ